MATDGWDVVLSFRTEEEAAARVVEDCRELGRQALAVQADVAEEADLHHLFEEAATLGPIRALVNNAGYTPSAATVADLTADRLQRLFAVNLTAAFLAAGLAVRVMSSDYGGSGGVIVNVSSRAAQLGSPGEFVDYAASKAAIDILTVGLAAEVAKSGVRVVGVRPGLIDTDIHAPGRLERLGSTPPMGRPGTADEVAAVIAFLASDQASYITGATLDVSGGR
jgi:NAD(P)-dependent dehydrogenase (short-subunit alcohol dehydrogenase family)